MTSQEIDRTRVASASQKHPSRVVVVHGGARDAYQLAVGLAGEHLLETLVTDVFWPADRAWARHLQPHLPAALQELLSRRSAAGLPSAKVRQNLLDGMRGLLLDRLPQISFETRRKSIRAADANLGRVAGERARRNGAGLVSYSYYGYDAMRAYGKPAMLFQLHPHPATMRRILGRELQEHPECSASLKQEWELALPEEDYQHLVEEPLMAARLLVASSFTRSSLVENGVPEESIVVVPYGVDLTRFRPDPVRREREDSKLHLLFVGRINQRKGIFYLLEALRLLDPNEVKLTVVGRVVDGLELFSEFSGQVEIRPSVSVDELVQAYQQADLFVFPSVAEGFGQVLLESLACGLPILSTTSTAAPDLIHEGVEGFVVDPRQPQMLAARIQWAIAHREALVRMRAKARERAEYFTWERFRTQSAEAVRSYLRLL